MDEGIELAPVLMMAAMSRVFRSRAEIKRREDDPEYAKQAAARKLLKAEKEYNAIYEQAMADNDEYECAPRAFMRRLAKSNEYSGDDSKRPVTVKSGDEKR